MQRFRALLESERAQLTAESDGIFNRAEGENRAQLTAEERARVDTIHARLKEIAEDLARNEERRDRERTVPALPDRAGIGITQVHDRAADQPWGFRTFGLTEDEFVRRYPAPFLAPTDARHPLRIYRATAFGEMLQATYAARVGLGVDPKLIYEAAAQGAGEIVGSDGGFAVQRDMLDQIELNIMTGDILSRIEPIPLSANSNGLSINSVDETSRVTGSRFGGVQGYWVDEGTAPTASRPKFKKIELKLRKLAALGYVTDELLADASALGTIMTQAFGEELRWLAENAIIRGTGSGSPLGILNANCLVTVAKETGQAAATLVTENIIKMWARLHASCRRNACWCINQDIEPQLFTMSLPVGTGGIPTFLPANGLSNQPYSTLFGKPIMPIEYCSTLGTVGDIILCDFGKYALITKGGVQQATSMHVAFTTDEMAFRATYRVDGQPKWRAPLTPANGSNTQSPFVALATRA